MNTKKVNISNQINELEVVGTKEGVVLVKLPTVEIPIEMTNQYFDKLKEEGNYKITYAAQAV